MRLLAASLVLFACVFAPACLAQDVYNEINVGTPPNGLFHGGEIDTVQLNNGNLHIEIPLWTVQGRGPLAPGAIFVLDTKQWTSKITYNKNTNTSTATIRTELNGTFGGVTRGLHYLRGSSTLHASSGTCVAYASNLVLAEANGTKHHLIPDPGDGCPAVKSWSIYYADDGSGFALNSGSNDLTKSGVQIALSTSTVTDTNGSQLSTTDTLGRSLSDGSLTYYDSGGNAQTIQVTYTSVPISTHLCQFVNGVDQCFEFISTKNEVSQIRLANGMTYTINYVQNDEGEPSSITLPSGAQISWTYNTGDSGGPAVATRTVTANGQSNTWTYTGISPCYTSCTISIVDSAFGNETDTTYTAFSAFPGHAPYNSNAFPLPYVTTKQTKDKSSGSLILVKTETTDYSTSIGPVLPIRVTTTWNQTNQVSKVETDYDSFTNSNISGFTFSASNPVARREYDWATGAPGNLLRRTAYNYLHLSNSNYLTANILNCLTSKTVYDSTANTCKGVSQACAQTTYAYDSTAITSTSGTPAPNHDYTGHGYTFAVRGNLTQTSRWLNSSGTWLNTTNSYDDLGDLRSTTDPLGNVTSFNYADNFTDGVNRNAQAFVTQVTHPVTSGVNHIEKKQFFWYTSLVAASCGQNFSSACSNTYSPPQPNYVKLTYDRMFRPLTITRGDGGSTTASYNDLTLPLSVTATSSITSSSNKITTGIFDDLYRIKQVQLNSDPDCSSGDRTDTTYDSLGRVHTVSNPYCSTGDATYGITTYAYDALGRTTQITQPDNSTLLTTYTGRATRVQDEGNGTQRATRIFQVDGLGRLVSVCEVSSGTLLGNAPTPAACGQDIAGTGFLTTDQYDALDNLTQVSQPGLNSRTFAYDSLSRLTSATNPESGTTLYTYDANANLQTKKDGRNITTTFAYDVLNRLISKTYSDGTPTATYGYDDPNAWGRTLTNTVGRMVTSGTTDSTGHGQGEVFSYDPMGRVIRDEQCIYVGIGGCITAFARYNLDGSLSSFTNVAGTQLTYGYNAAAHLTSVTSSLSDANHPGTLLSGFQYNALGRPILDTVGNSGITDHFGYSNRGWISSYWACSVPGSSCSSAQIVYTFNMTNPQNGLGYAPNGNILYGNDWVNGNWTYGYDDFNRLSSSVCGSGAATCPGSQTALGYQYKFDRFGNRWQKNLTAGSGTISNLSFDANNHIIGSPYQIDLAGNLVNDGSHTYTYDAENRLTKVDGGSTASYTYDAQGRRVSKVSSAGTIDYLYDMSGRQSVVVNSSASPIRSEIYAASRHLGTYTNGTTYFSFTDWLGTERVRAGVNGAVVETCESAPYGDMQSCTGTDLSPLHFTGKERDSESGLDNFGARYFGSGLGRFTSADSFTVKLLANPQDLDLYAYALNNPLRYYDPDGRDWKDSLNRLVGAFTIKGSVGLGAADRKEVAGTGYKGKAEVKASVELSTEKGVTGKVTTEVGGEVSVGGKKYGTGVTATNASVTVHPDGTVDAQTKTTTEVSVNGHSTSSSDVTSGGSSNGEFTIFAVETTTLVPIGEAAIPVTESSELSVDLKEALDAFHDLRKDLANMFGNPGPPPPPSPPTTPAPKTN